MKQSKSISKRRDTRQAAALSFVLISDIQKEPFTPDFLSIIE
jgi:hypothetical protein